MFFKSDEDYSADEDYGADSGARDNGVNEAGRYHGAHGHGGGQAIKNRAWTFLENNAGRFFGGLAGLAFAILILAIGLAKTFLIGALVFLGACIGGYKDGRGALYRFLTWYKNRKR